MRYSDLRRFAMRAEILRGSGYSACRVRLETLLDISVLASDMDIHNCITQGFLQPDW